MYTAFMTLLVIVIVVLFGAVCYCKGRADEARLHEETEESED